ncbi:N-acetylornithine carbamoyltransferase [Candidatus Woesearchaeota archaeon]|nr:N-acetylornithine carbamoyltransferase [Candidatus Woesearchaeota archaeon]
MNFISTADYSQEELEKIITQAVKYKHDKNKMTGELSGKTVAALFFNPSTRTRTSFDVALYQLGGHMITLEPGKGSWGVEVQEGIVMDGDAEEHIKEATRVLNRYCDGIAVRAFPAFKNWNEDKKDPLINAMVKYSSKPIINMETILHPCQALAMMMTLKEKMKTVKRKKMTLLWGYHPKGLNTAVANSAALIAGQFGMDVTLAYPEGYDLDPLFIERTKEFCRKNGSTCTIVHDPDKGVEGADFVYVKSWGSLKHYGQFDRFKAEHDKNKNWILDARRFKKTNNGYFSHCLPLRRNMNITDAVIDAQKSLIIEEAENRLWVQKALLAKLLG